MILASILIIIFGLIWGGEFMLFLFGAEYKTAGLLLFWLLFSILFILPNYILTQASIALDREVSYAKIVIFVALLNIVLNIFLIPEFGAVGAAWSTIVAEGFLCLNLCWIMRSRLRGID
jgi:O-antigen/teichoic acid export membrane protein